MALKIKESASYIVGRLKDKSVREYPEFLAQKKRSIFGSVITAECKTWEEFFAKNPLNLTKGIWSVYEVKPDGKNEWLIDGEPTQHPKNQGLNDDELPVETLRTNSNTEKVREQNEDLIRQIREVKREHTAEIAKIRAEYDARLESFIDENRTLKADKLQLQQAYEKKFDEKLEDTKTIKDLQYEVEKLKENKDRELDTLKDNFARKENQSGAIAELITLLQKKDNSLGSQMKNVLLNDLLPEMRPYIGGILEGVSDMLKTKYGKNKQADTTPTYDG